MLGKVENILAKKQVTLGLDLTLDGAPVTGTATIDFAGETLGVRARLSGLSLAGVAFDDIFVEYAGNMLYVNYGGKAKVKLSASDLAGLLGSAMPAENTFDLAALLQQILAGNFQTAADGREISFGATLGLLGYDLPISLRLANGADGAFSHIFADVTLAEGIPLLGGKKIGAELTIQDAALPALTDAEKGSYYDLAPVLEMLPEILENKAISLGGSVKIGSKDGSVALTLQNGVLSWKDGLRLSFDLGIGADTIEQTLSLSLNTKTQRVQLKYGDVGVDVAYDQLEKLTAAFDAVLDRIRRESQYFIEGFDLDAALDGLLAGRSLTEFVGEITGIDLSALEGVLNGLGGTGEGNALEDLLADLSIVAPQNGGFVALSLGAFTAELGYKNGALTVLLPEAALGSCTLTASLKAGTSDGNVREWNEKDFLTVDDFVELIDFAGAAVATVSAGDVALSFETLTAKSGSSTFAVQGSLAYHMGSLDGSEGRGPFFTLDQDGKSLIANPNAFLYIDLWLEDLSKTDAASDLYLELWMFDDGSTEAGAVYEPVFYVILSHYKPDSDQYDPFTFKVAAGEILTLLASGISLVETPLKDLMISTGIPEDTVNVLFDAIDEYVISKRLVGEELGQVGAIGEMLVKTLGLENLLSGGSVVAGDGAEAAAKAAVGNYLTALTLKRNGDKTVFDLRLDSDLLFGGSGKKDLSVTLTKEGAVGASYLSEVTLGGIYSGDSCTDASFRFSRSPLALDNVTKTITQGGTQYAVLDDAMAFEFAGADELIKAIARSATHKTESGKYELNKLIHISGKATIKIDGLDWLFGSAELGIDGLAISFGENGEVTANAKISYSTGGLGGIAFASSGYTELTIKGDMVYMRRCKSDGTYRDSNAMTLETFMGDILGQVAYILNFSNTVKGFLPDNVGGSSSDNSGKDLGSQVKGILSGYAYDANYQGGGTKRWQFVLNGEELTGALDDIVIGLMTNANGALSALDVGTGISVLSINANLTLDNPGDEWGGKTDQTQDISGLIPDLYNVTIIAPASLGSAWKQNADGTYSRTVQMFKDRPIKFVYGDDVREQKVTEGENIFDLTTLTDGRIQWQNSTFSYTAGGCTIEIALTPDTVVYNSTIEFSMGGEAAKSFTAEFDKATTLYATPTAEGYTFLGWYVLENGTPKKVTELAYSGTGGASTIVEAMWVKDITGGTIVGERSEKKSGIDKTLYYTAQVSVEGGTLSGAYSDQFALAASVTCRFRLALTDHASATTDQFANGTFAEVEASHSYWASAFSYCDQIYAEVQLIYRLNGVDVCVVKATLFAKYDTSVAAGVSSVEVQDPSVTVYN